MPSAVEPGPGPRKGAGVVTALRTNGTGAAVTAVPDSGECDALSRDALLGNVTALPAGGECVALSSDALVGKDPTLTG